MRLFDVRSRRQLLGREYSGAATNPRLYAHTMADEVHHTQANLQGVARTKLTFSSDRVRDRATDTVEQRNVKEIFIADYDGANQRRVTVNRQLNVFPTWSPDGRAIAYTSYRRGYPDIFISLIYQGTMETPTNGTGQNWLPAFSPDGTRIAFTSNRDGNSEIYVMNRDGSGLRRLTDASGDRLDADLVAVRHAGRLHVGSHRRAADLGRQRRRTEPPPPDVRVVCRPSDLVAGALQRDRVRGADRFSLRHQDLPDRQRRDAADHVRRGHQREPGVGAQRQAPRVHVDADRPREPDLRRPA